MSASFDEPPVILPSQMAVARIQRLVANTYGIDQQLLKMRERRRSVAWPRQVAMYLARKTTGKSVECIGRCFGGLDHTSVIHAVRAVEGRMATVPYYREDIDALLARLQG